ncbi:MAG: hypothetical protein JNL45_12485 [Hyphomicrobium sp.]|nr:hypothetical protein [Hyphomicrobium sp.]
MLEQSIALQEANTTVENLRPSELFAQRVQELIDDHTRVDDKGRKEFFLYFPDVNDRLKPNNSVANTRFALTKLKVAITYDEFAMVFVVVNLPGHTRVTDSAVRLLWKEFQRLGYKVSLDNLYQHLYAIGEEVPFHPLRKLFNELEAKWDGKPRLATFLIRLAKVEDNAFTRFVSISMMVAAVRRIRQPGFGYKYVPVLEGGQDARKSSFLRALAHDHYFDDNLELGSSSKETIELTGGKLIVEFGELASKRRNELEKLKAFLARAVDRARPAYGRVVQEVPRQFIACGTTNDELWLSDPTGNVRFWPLKCGATADDPIDIDGLKDELEQLWGEAAYLERQAAKSGDLAMIYPPKEISALARSEQDARYVGDEIYDRLVQAIDTAKVDDTVHHCGYAVVTNESIREAVGVTDDMALSPMIAQSIRRAMQKSGWKATNRRVNGVQTRLYYKGNLPRGDVAEGCLLLDSPGKMVRATMLIEGSCTGTN